MSKPKIYGFCKAGCQWETVHIEDFLKSASIVKLALGDDGYYDLEIGRTYKVKNTAAAGEWGFSLYASGISSLGARYSGQIDMPEYDKYADGLKIKHLGIEPSSDYISLDYIYEINGERKKAVAVAKARYVFASSLDMSKEMSQTFATPIPITYNPGGGTYTNDSLKGFEISTRNSITTLQVHLSEVSLEIYSTNGGWTNTSQTPWEITFLTIASFGGDFGEWFKVNTTANDVTEKFTDSAFICVQGATDLFLVNEDATVEAVLAVSEEDKAEIAEQIATEGFYTSDEVDAKIAEAITTTLNTEV